MSDILAFIYTILTLAGIITIIVVGTAFSIVLIPIAIVVGIFILFKFGLENQ